ncbi:carboxylesterase [Lyophyllum atratum]|nr:carboxylesterase [Lyophyllum atratum]
MLLQFIALTLTLASSTYAQLEGLLVPTRQGPIIGTLVNPSVRQFLGVPFAVANRWEAPRLPPTHIRPFRATNFSDSCLQAFNPGNVEFLRLAGARDSDIFVPESENCLTVNIWTPSVRRKQRTAVLLWVYGGGFQFGTSNIPTYNGQNIVRDNDDILVVTFNYRLNIFGFPNAPQLANKTQSQNFGLLDLDAVVQWVHDNIAAFGGDPDRIVLFGQSAGGVAIDAYTFAHPQDTRVKGVIEQSGRCAEFGVLILISTSTSGATSWNVVASVVGCGNVTDAAQLTCMKQIPFRKLEDAVISTNANFGLAVDDITIFSDTGARAASGDFLHVPLLGGTTAHEGDIFVVDAQEVAAGVVIPTLTELLADLQTQSFTCSTGKSASDRVRAGVPTWRYQYQGVFPDISTRPDLRAYHASEIPMVFGTYSANPTPPATSTEIALSKFIQGAWVAFARDPQRGLVNMGWPAYSPNTTTLAQLGNFFNQTGAVFTQGQLVDFLCNFAPTLASVNAQLTGLLIPTGAAIN